jgi:hypothetical protein
MAFLPAPGRINNTVDTLRVRLVSLLARFGKRYGVEWPEPHIWLAAVLLQTEYPRARPPLRDLQVQPAAVRVHARFFYATPLTP